MSEVAEVAETTETSTDNTEQIVEEKSMLAPDTEETTETTTEKAGDEKPLLSPEAKVNSEESGEEDKAEEKAEEETEDKAEKVEIWRIHFTRGHGDERSSARGNSTNSCGKRHKPGSSSVFNRCSMQDCSGTSKRAGKSAGRTNSNIN